MKNCFIFEILKKRIFTSIFLGCTWEKFERDWFREFDRFRAFFTFEKCFSIDPLIIYSRRFFNTYLFRVGNNDICFVIQRESLKFIISERAEENIMQSSWNYWALVWKIYFAFAVEDIP